MHSKTLFFIALTSTTIFIALPAISQTPDAATGKSAFEKRCTGCHTLERDKVGPRLGGVVGRKAGSISTFAYSDAVKKSGIVWNEALLDKWLTDTETVIPDNDMTFRLASPQERAAIIAYLKETGK